MVSQNGSQQSAVVIKVGHKVVLKVVRRMRKPLKPLSRFVTRSLSADSVSPFFPTADLPDPSVAPTTVINSKTPPPPLVGILTAGSEKASKLLVAQQCFQTKRRPVDWNQLHRPPKTLLLLALGHHVQYIVHSCSLSCDKPTD